MQVEEEAFKEIRFYICGVFLDKLMGQDKKKQPFWFKKTGQTCSLLLYKKRQLCFQTM